MSLSSLNTLLEKASGPDKVSGSLLVVMLEYA